MWQAGPAQVAPGAFQTPHRLSLQIFQIMFLSFFNSILTEEPWKTLQLSAENIESKTKLELTGKTAIQVKSNPTQACQALSAMFSNFGHKNHVLLQL